MQCRETTKSKTKQALPPWKSMLLSMPHRVPKLMTVYRLPHALYLGTFVGHNNKKHEAWANFEAVDDLLRIRLV